MGGDGIANCLEAGITTIEHGVFLTEALCERMARDGVALVPTLVAPAAIAAGGVAGGLPRYRGGESPPVGGRPLGGVSHGAGPRGPHLARPAARAPPDPHVHARLPR